MTRVYVDSSVLFSAAYSSKGHSREVLLMAAREEITVVISQLVVDETRRNLADHAPHLIEYLELIIAAIPFEYIRPTKSEVLGAAEYVVLKDAPIVAAAKKAKVDLLITLDKKHLLDKQEIVEASGVAIVTPKEAVEYLRKTNR